MRMCISHFENACCLVVLRWCNSGVLDVMFDLGYDDEASANESRASS